MLTIGEIYSMTDEQIAAKNKELSVSLVKRIIFRAAVTCAVILVVKSIVDHLETKDGE